MYTPRIHGLCPSVLFNEIALLIKKSKLLQKGKRQGGSMSCPYEVSIWVIYHYVVRCPHSRILYLFLYIDGLWGIEIYCAFLLWILFLTWYWSIWMGKKNLVPMLCLFLRFISPHLHDVEVDGSFISIIIEMPSPSTSSGHRQSSR